MLFKAIGRGLIKAATTGGFKEGFSSIMGLEESLRYLAAGKTSDAKATLSIAYSQDGTNKEAILAIAVINQYYEHNNYAAEIIYQEIIQAELADDKNKWSWFAHKHLAIIKALEGNDIEADNNFKRAIFKNRSDAELIYKYGLFCQIKGRNDEATQYYRDAISHDPRYAADVSMTSPNIEYLKRINIENTFQMN